MHKSDGIFDSHHWEERVRKVAQLILNYLKENDDPQRKVVEYQKAVDLQQFLDLHIAPQGIDFETLLQEIEKYLKFSVRTGHKKFSNQLYSGLTWPALIGEVLATITN